MKNDFIKAVYDLKAVQEQIKQLEEKKEALRSVIIAEMKGRDLESCDIGDYIVQYRVTVSKKFDNKTFKEQCKDVYKTYLIDREVEYLAIKPKKTKTAEKEKE